MDNPTGKTLVFNSPHHGHTLTVAGTHEDYPKAYVLICECGKWTTMGEHWLSEHLEAGEYTSRDNWSDSEPPIVGRPKEKV